MVKLLNMCFVACFVLILVDNAGAIQSNKNKVVSQKSKVQLVDKRFAFTEGPAPNNKGEVYFTDQPNDRIYIWNEDEGISLYLEGTGRSNGMYFNDKGQLVSCADEHNQLVYFDKNKDRVVLQEAYMGIHLNAPNDLWIAPSGDIYFTDPYYHRPWWSSEHKEEQDTRGVYLWSKGKQLRRVVADFNTPNGIIGTPDGKHLYVADIADGKTWRYTIGKDGQLNEKFLFAPKGSDGMTIDDRGNVYLTSGKVWVYNPSGELIKEIECPEKPANVCFGGKKRNILFITARTGVYIIKMKVRGVQ